MIANSPALCYQYVLRNKFIYDQIQQDIKSPEKTTQIVNIGCGYDLIPEILTEHYSSLSRIINIDLPDVIENRRKLTRYAIRDGLIPGTKTTIKMIPCDLTNPTLLDKAFKDIDRDIKTLFIAKGLLMYMPEKNIEHLIQKISEFPISSLYATHLEFLDLKTAEKKKSPYKSSLKSAGFNQAMESAFPKHRVTTKPKEWLNGVPSKTEQEKATKAWDIEHIIAAHKKQHETD